MNPYIIKVYNGFVVCFLRRSGKILAWKQGYFGRKMKSSRVDLPEVVFPTIELAEKEIKDIIIPHLLSEKDVEANEIMGW